MLILKEYPPIYTDILKVFPILAKKTGVIYSWGTVIYNPDGIHIPGSLKAHEAIHGERQGEGVEAWWTNYLDDPEFRLHEEVLAHTAEYTFFLYKQSNRKERRGALANIAKRLSSPLYGNMLSRNDAKKLIVKLVQNVSEKDL